MDDLLRDFLIESSEHLETIDAELVRFEQNPNNQEILSNIFRLVHTIKGTCGFLGLPRLETLAHAAETLMGKFRDGMPVTSDAVTLILTTLDQIKALLAHLEQGNGEPDGSDADLIERLETMAAGGAVAVPAAPVPAEVSKPSSAPYQTLERPLMPGEIPLDDHIAHALGQMAGRQEFLKHSVDVLQYSTNGRSFLKDLTVAIVLFSTEGAYSAS